MGNQLLQGILKFSEIAAGLRLAIATGFEVSAVDGDFPFWGWRVLDMSDGPVVHDASETSQVKRSWRDFDDAVLANVIDEPLANMNRREATGPGGAFDLGNQRLEAWGTAAWWREVAIDSVP